MEGISKAFPFLLPSISESELSGAREGSSCWTQQLLDPDSRQGSSSQQRAMLRLYTAGQTPHPCTRSVQHTALTLQRWATINRAQEVAFIQLFICAKFQVHTLCILRVTFDLGGVSLPTHSTTGMLAVPRYFIPPV